MAEQNVGNKVIGGLFWKFMERISAQLVTFIVSIVLARLLTPEDYGTITMVTVFISIANVFVSSGFGTALIQKKNADDIDFSSVFFFNILFSVCIYVFLWLCAPYIAVFYNMPILVSVLRVLSLKIILAGVNSVQQAYVSRHMIFKRFFWSTLIGTIVSALVGIVMAIYGFGVWALVAQYLVNSFIGTVVLWFTVKWRPVFKFSVKRLKGLISFGWKILADNLITTFYDNLKSLVIGKKYTSSDLAYYSKGIQFPNLFVSNINYSISAVLFPALSQMQDDYSAIRRGMQKSIRMSSFFLIPLMTGMFVVASGLIEILLTEKWLPCVIFLRIACIYYAFYPITTANLQAINAIGRSDVSLRLTLIKKMLGIALILIAMKFGVVAIAVSDVIGTLLAVFINTYYNNKFFKYSLFEQILDILPSLVCSLIMGGSVYICGNVLGNFIEYELLIMLVQTITGMICYMISSFIFNKQDLEYMWNRVKMLKK